jgi:hypothetical protein
VTQDEFRAAMNAANREDRLLFVANDDFHGIAVGYDSGTDEAVLHGGSRAPLAGLREIRSPI